MAQNEAAIWYFGENAGLDFNSGAPVALTDGAMITQEGCATISDGNGNLLFYTSGVTVWDRTHNPMPNGTGLLGDFSSSQSAIVVPDPGNPDLYYVFTVDDLGGPNGFQYSVVDMTSNGGLGDVTLKNIPLTTPVAEKLTAVEHANGTDIWVLVHTYGNDQFLAYLVTPTGLVTTPVVSAVGENLPLHSGARGVGGYMKISPDGQFLAYVTGTGRDRHLFRFDTLTGQVSDFIELNPYFPASTNTVLNSSYGVEFSTDSSKLYITSSNFYRNWTSEHNIHQFDLSTYSEATILASGVEIAPMRPGPEGAIQLGIDGKIYIAEAYQNALSVINDPNLGGLACNYVPDAVPLASGISRLGLPPFIQSFFVVGLRARNFCLGDATEFEVTSTDPILSIAWDFGDGYTSTLETPIHTYAAAGTYPVSVTVTTTADTKTESKDITIYEVPTANVATNEEVCHVADTFPFDVTTKTAEILGVQDPNDFQLQYFSSATDRDANLDPLTSTEIFDLGTTTIYVKVTNRLNTSCSASTEFDILIKRTPDLLAVPDSTVCDDDGDGLFTFDLSYWDDLIAPAMISVNVSYHASQADADANMNPLPNNYTNTNPTEIIYFRIENATYPECYEVGNFQLEVIDQVIANTPGDLVGCTSYGGYNLDMPSFDSAVLGAQDPNDFSVTYFLSQADADTNSNALTSLHSFDYGTTPVFARVTNNNNQECYATTQFNIIAREAPLVDTITDWTVCDDDTDGFFTFDLSQKNTEIFNGQDETKFEILYFASQADADAGTNALPLNYTNTAATETIFVRFQNSTYTDCYRTGSFVIEVIHGVTANQPADLSICDENNDGQAIFDLTQTETEIIGAQNPNSLNLSYHETQADADSGENPLNADSYLSPSYQNTIYVRVENASDTSCYATTSFDLNIYDTPAVPQVADWQVCDDNNDGIYLFDFSKKETEILSGSTGTNISFYVSQTDAETAQNGITGNYQNISNPQTIYFRLENSNNAQCYSVSSFQLQVFDTPRAYTASDIIICDTDEAGRYYFDLSEKDAEVLNGQDPLYYDVSYHGSENDALNNIAPLSTANYQNTNLNEILWARVQHTDLESCFDVSSFNLIVNPLPQMNMEERYVICPDSPDLILDGGDFESWSWQSSEGVELSTNRNFNVSVLGTYQLIVRKTTNGVRCENSRSFEVLSSGAPESMEVEVNGFSDQIDITVTATGTGPFEYSVDGENYQASNKFVVFPGKHTVFVRDLLECRVISEEIIAIGYQRFFTPNGDGNNEFWNIIGAELYPASRLFIYDRYGKFIVQVSPNSKGWDGSYNGNPLPASDYWFNYQYGTDQTMTGHFTLKR
ncbi:gliding motility-associated C-terminal domain-containing protein [Maribacter sedimenticola]|uniref:Gliding motility-associated C-terminal domain-containing protein n=2 Tax=Maribacter sedimenticola TaxID=228956 RepID=A0ABY1SMA3_9FLAO|nr:gliding motility-associated C-terminal domain-containing protein [Maribacter sedimenticola]